MAWRNGHVGDQKESVVALCRNNPIYEKCPPCYCSPVPFSFLVFVTLWPCGLGLRRVELFKGLVATREGRWVCVSIQDRKRPGLVTLSNATWITSRHALVCSAVVTASPANGRPHLELLWSAGSSSKVSVQFSPRET